MKKQVVWASALVLALSLPLVGCSSDDSSDDTSDDTTEEEEATEDEEEESTDEESTEEESTDEEASEEESSDEVDTSIYVGQWHGSVETDGTSVYGTTGGTESMLDIYLNEDGTCYTEPEEAHTDLLTDEGTWETDGSTITLTMSDRTIVLTLTDDDECEADPTDFDIDGFDVITFVYYG